MKTRHKTIATTTATGIAGLALLVGITVPSGAGPVPSLPEISAEDLVTSVLTSPPPAFNGTVAMRNELGLPALPGMPAQLSNNATGRVWHDRDKTRLSTAGTVSEQTVITDGASLWIWDSADRSARKYTDKAKDRRAHAQQVDPAMVAREALSMLRATSTVSVSGTATVADRAVYTLVLRPAPTERTLLREVRIAVDAEKRMPLEVAVLANNATEPVIQVGFTELTYGPQDAALFQFTPPPGAKVTDESQETKQPESGSIPGPDDQLAKHTKIVGTGWDTVAVTKIDQVNPEQPSKDGGEGRVNAVNALLKRIGKPISGPWGSGVEVNTQILTAVIADDGRVAVGAVPSQVLSEALGGNR